MTGHRIEQETNLVLAARQGDARAFQQLYERHVDPLFRFLCRFTDDREQVQDLVQRAFIKAYENLASFDGISMFSTWLFKLAINEFRMDYRRSRIVQFEPSPEEESAAPVDEENAFVWTSTMNQWLAGLDETKRAVFLLSEVEGYSHAEIAEMLHIREGTSRTILTRARQYLRQRWEEEQRTT